MLIIFYKRSKKFYSILVIYLSNLTPATFLLFNFVTIFLYTNVVFSQSENSTRIVNTPQGPVRGHMDPEGDVYAFYNIPYATAPTGVDKFKAPMDPPVWTEVFDAVDRQILCPQPWSRVMGVMQEDCLVANVFVPDTNETNISVLVNIHGGAYQYSFGNAGTINYFVRTKKLIVVTFNYRLGVHGFLCLGTECAPGNAALKDQVALLRWVKANIGSFGGNPEEVTIFGCSAGGGSVDILTLSSITNSLFKRAIIESGAALGAVVVQNIPITNAQNYAKILNFDNANDLNALQEFYTTVSLEILTSQHNVITNRPNSTVSFGPCVERDIGQERVVEDAPINIIRQGKHNRIPLIYGYANMEGIMRVPQFQSWKNLMNENFADFLPGDLYFESIDDKYKVAETVKEFYFGDQPVSEENILSYIDYFTDVLFGYPILNLLKIRLESFDDTIFLHEYSFVDENTPSIPFTDEKGANHCDQRVAIFDEDKSNITDEYITMKAIMREYWLAFILNGSPWSDSSTLQQWPRANLNRGPYMSFGSTVVLKNILNEERAAFWDAIYREYYQDPLPPNSANILVSLNVMIASSLMILYLLYFIYY